MCARFFKIQKLSPPKKPVSDPTCFGLVLFKEKNFKHNFQMNFEMEGGMFGIIHSNYK